MGELSFSSTSSEYWKIVEAYDYVAFALDWSVIEGTLRPMNEFCNIDVCGREIRYRRESSPQPNLASD